MYFTVFLNKEEEDEDDANDADDAAAADDDDDDVNVRLITWPFCSYSAILVKDNVDFKVSVYK